MNVLSAAQLSETKNNSRIKVAGMVLLRQRPSTAKGITFVTLEDETGVANLVVKQPIWDKFYAIARRSPAWVAHGKLESRYSVVHVVVSHLEDLAEQLNRVSLKPRNFR